MSVQLLSTWNLNIVGVVEVPSVIVALNITEPDSCSYSGIKISLAISWKMNNLMSRFGILSSLLRLSNSRRSIFGCFKMHSTRSLMLYCGFDV